MKTTLVHAAPQPTSVEPNAVVDYYNVQTKDLMFRSSAFYVSFLANLKNTNCGNFTVGEKIKVQFDPISAASITKVVSNETCYVSRFPHEIEPNYYELITIVDDHTIHVFDEDANTFEVHYSNCPLPKAPQKNINKQIFMISGWIGHGNFVLPGGEGLCKIDSMKLISTTPHGEMH